MRVIAIDPGDTTGVFYHDGSGNHGHLQLPGWSVVPWLEGFIDGIGIDHLVLEKFNLYDKRPKANAQWALDVLGCVRYLAHVHEIPCTEQWNRDKNQVTNEDLAERGILMRPLRQWKDANDAARHYVYFMNRKK